MMSNSRDRWCLCAVVSAAGMGFKHNPPLFLQEGGVFEVEIEEIECSRNPVVNPVPVRRGQ